MALRSFLITLFHKSYCDAIRCMVNFTFSEIPKHPLRVTIDYKRPNSFLIERETL